MNSIEEIKGYFWRLSRHKNFRMPVDALKKEFDYFSPKVVCQLRNSSYPRISVLTHDEVVLTPVISGLTSSEARFPTRSVLTHDGVVHTPSEARLTHASACSPPAKLGLPTR